MLSERQLEAILAVFQHRAQAVTEEYLIRMGQHLRDIGTLSPSDINRLVELKRLNYNMEQIKRQIAKAANVPLEDVEMAFRAIAESDLRFAEKVFAADHTPAIKANTPLERILKAQAKITKQQLSNLSQTTLLSDAYKNAIDVAVQTVQAGITDYNGAIRRAMKAAAKDGLRVQYPNSGISRRLDSAVRMNVLDGVRAINQDVMRQVGKEFGADGIELSAHMLCAEDHLPYQGTQMSNKDFDRLQNRLDRPFGMWNCRHTRYPILLGISQPAHTPEELAQYKQYSRERIEVDGVIKSRYEWSQEQRRIETAIRYQKDIAVAAKASGDIVARRECAYMIRELDKYYQKISAAAGLNEQRNRMRVAGFSAVKPADELKTSVAEHARLRRNYNNTVAEKALDAPGFVDKFKAITGNKAVNDAIYNSAVQMLKHRNGTNREDLYLIDGKTGEIIHAHTTSEKDYAVVYDDAIKLAIANAKQAGKSIIAMHNHPNGLPPTMDDGVSAFARGYEFGVVVGHNMEVFTYSTTSKNYTTEDCKKAHAIINQATALEVDFDEELWYTVLEKYGMKVRRIIDG